MLNGSQWMCPRKLRLLAAYVTANAAKSQAVTQFGRRVGTGQRDGIEAARKIVGSTRSEAAIALSELDHHACGDSCIPRTETSADTPIRPYAETKNPANENVALKRT